MVLWHIHDEMKRIYVVFSEMKLFQTFLIEMFPMSWPILNLRAQVKDITNLENICFKTWWTKYILKVLITSVNKFATYVPLWNFLTLTMYRFSWIKSPSQDYLHREIAVIYALAFYSGCQAMIFGSCIVMDHIYQLIKFTKRILLWSEWCIINVNI